MRGFALCDMASNDCYKLRQGAPLGGARVKTFMVLLLGLLLLTSLPSCGQSKKGLRADDPYLYRRGEWNLSKGGILDDIPQFLWQMCESMFDFGKQPVDPPSSYEAQPPPQRQM